jgi:hypothetical protein
MVCLASDLIPKLSLLIGSIGGTWHDNRHGHTHAIEEQLMAAQVVRIIRKM